MPEDVTQIPVGKGNAPKYDKLLDLEQQLDAVGEIFTGSSIGKLEYLRTQIILEQTKVLQVISDTLALR